MVAGNGRIGRDHGQQYDPALHGAMKWRMIGPFRGGRTVAVDGIPDQPNVFFIGVNNGGVWKTTDHGQTWQPIFDGQPTQSVGALTVAPSDPNIIHAGSGEIREMVGALRPLRGLRMTDA